MNRIESFRAGINSSTSSFRQIAQCYLAIFLLLQISVAGAIPVGTITTVAGNGTTGYSGDGGAAKSAALHNPQGVALDQSGNLYIADTYGHRIRKVSAATGVISTLAGTGINGYSGDGGAAASAMLNYPIAVRVDNSGNVYIADHWNHRIRKINAATGIITTIAGNGTGAFGGDGGGSTVASLNYPAGMAFDNAGNLYVADVNNHAIRKISTQGIISTVAGTGTSSGFSGDGGMATSAHLSSPYGVTVDGAGNIYIADSGNHRVRFVSVGTGQISTVAGNGNAAFNGDGGVATNSSIFFPYDMVTTVTGDLYISDGNNNRIRKVAAGTGIISTVAGTGTSGFSGDGGSSTSATIGFPTGLVLDISGGLYFADNSNSRIRMVNLGPSAVSIIAPSAPQTVAAASGILQATLSFTAPASNGGATIDSYTASCTAGGVTQTASGPSSPLTVTGLAGGTVYSCSVYAHNSVGNGVASAAVSVVPSSPVTAPTAPQSVSVTSGIQQVTLSFTAPASNGGAAIDSYTASCSGGGVTKTVSGANSPLTLSALTGGMTYACSVFAHNSVGNGPASTVVNVTPASPVTAPSAPQSVTITSGIQQVTLSFSTPATNGGAAIDSYTASCTVGGVTQTVTGTTSPLVVTGLTAGVQYSCSVTAHNSAGSSSATAGVSVTPSPSPSVGAEAVFYCAETLYSPVFNARVATVSSGDGKYFMRSYPSGWILGVTTDGAGFYFIPPAGSLTYLDTLANVSNAYCKPYGLGF
ncbi:MAG: fibronectin type III domain-containing protein [Sulfuricella sp.]|nr:fibronectin type III domain-containing protein [Sulfuricella sp.]